MTTFVEDHRKSNPSLHLLYVKWGTKHLQLIDQCIEKLDETSNLNMHGAIGALIAERDKLVKTNAAYADANEILLGLAGKDVPDETEEVTEEE